jgi:hypothetical protein
MKKIKHRTAAIVFAVTICAAQTLALVGPASASTARPDPVSPYQRDDIVCGGDLCLRTVYCNTDSGVALVELWADRTSFFGHFELVDPEGRVSSSNTKNWVAGGVGYSFEVFLYLNQKYRGVAWKYEKGYHKIGQKICTINGC